VRRLERTKWQKDRMCLAAKRGHLAWAVVLLSS